MPGEVVYKKTIAGKERWQPVTLEYGYFWMLRDLRQTNDKPFISNTQLIPENEAKVFPYLSGLSCLDNKTSDMNNAVNKSSDTVTTIDIPAYWLRKNRTRDPSAQCTLVGMAFRDYGYLQLNDWLRPFAEAFHTNDRVETVRLNLNEGYLNRYLLKGIITTSMRRNTPATELSSTFIHFAADLQNFRDPIRAHNLMPGYIYLLDGLGRVRFAATGPASLEEVEKTIELARELLRPTIQGSTKRSHKR
jgi:ATPase complex subunit ATP10